MMRNRMESTPTLSGSLLVAHPSLQDPNFKRAIVLLSAHTEDDGAMGIVLNRPMDKRLRHIDEQFEKSVLADVPVYEGGPVQNEQMIIAAWKWSDDRETFQLYFGLGPEKAIALQENDPEIDIRAFFGYSGWESGQLEQELEQDAWLVSPVRYEALERDAAEHCWRDIVLLSDPDLRFFADAPDDPSLN